jgi:hypothetical protein
MIMKKTYAMFTPAGNAAVRNITLAAKAAKLSWTTVEAMLTALSYDSRYAEALDTEVRECVYAELNKSAKTYIL